MTARRALWRKRAEWLLAVLPPGSIVAGPLLGERHAERWRGRPWAASSSDLNDYRRIQHRGGSA